MTRWFVGCSRHGERRIPCSRRGNSLAGRQRLGSIRSALSIVAYHIELFGCDASIVGVYRALHQDFEDGSGARKFEWDMTLHGLVVGLNIRF